jgi:hypothetical protein
MANLEKLRGLIRKLNETIGTTENPDFKKSSYKNKVGQEFASYDNTKIANASGGVGNVSHISLDIPVVGPMTYLDLETEVTRPANKKRWYYTKAELRSFEQRRQGGQNGTGQSVSTTSQGGIPNYDLMDDAGKAAARRMRDQENKAKRNLGIKS